MGKARYIHFKWKSDHSRAIPLAAKYTLCFFFPIESAQHVMLFLWIGSQNDSFCLEVAIGLLVVTRLE